MNFSDFFKESFKEQEEEFNTKEMALGLEEEKKEHKDIWERLLNWSEDNDYELPFTEDEFFEMIVKAHLKEYPNYYSEISQVEHEKKYEEKEPEEESRQNPDKPAGIEDKKETEKETVKEAKWSSVPTRMQVQKEVEKLLDLGKSLGQINTEVCEMFGLSNLSLTNDGTVVSFKVPDNFKESDNVFNRHQKAIALKTLRMNDAMANVMGGMNKKDAIDFLRGIGYSDEQLKKILSYNGHSEEEIINLLSK